ncbi:MAG: endolytic transglycosylase MltG [Alistipes sp.]|nr:endolytic transglycosylase MltG [Alistipes sp.]
MSKKNLAQRLKYLFLGAVVVAAAVAAIAFWQFRGNALRGEYELFLSRKADYQALTDSLMPHLKHRAAFRFYARHLNLEQSFKPGHYCFAPKMDVIRVVRMLKLGEQTPVRVTINNARTHAFLAGKLAGQIDADSVEIYSVLTNPATAKRVGFSELTLFSMFLPDTYECYWTMTPDEWVDRMKREYDRFWNEEREAKRKRIGLTRLEVMTIASIVYEETRQTDEMPRVAGVYINRLKKGMKLQADPTVKYAMQDFSLRRILHKHLQYDSPYNTYRYKGLPPSPICMPGKNAIEAVLNYEKHNYLFFCARPTFDGYHNFAVTYAEHKRNARAYSAELNRRKIK